jgi:hypothetical protein
MTTPESLPLLLTVAETASLLRTTRKAVTPWWSAVSCPV